MKFSKLIAMSALWLTATAATATIVDGVRQKPVPASFASYQVGDTVYLYNTGAKMFFLGANDYSTRASVGNQGYKVIFTLTDSCPDGMVELKDSVETKSAWMSTFAAADGEAIWVDNNSETYRYWTVTPVGDAYRIANTQVRDGAFMGWNGETTDTRLYLLDPAAEGAAVDWKLVVPAVYNAWAALMPAYEKAAELKGYIDEAEGKGINVDAQKQVYLDENASIEELENAIKEVKDALAHHAEQSATVNNPQEMTSKILNPTFNGNSYASWSGTPFAGNGAKDNAEHYNKNYDTYQKVSDLPNGVYALGVKAFYRAGNPEPAYANYKAQNEQSRYAKLYAVTGADTLRQAIVSPFTAAQSVPTGVGNESTVTDSETGQTLIVPNNMVAAEYYMHTLNAYDNKLLVGINSGEMTIGVEKTVTIGGDWSIFDDFSLTYYGNSAEAFAYWINQTKSALPAYDGIVATVSYIEEYNQTIASASASTFEEAMAAIKAIQAAEAKLKENAATWQEYIDLVEGEGRKAIANEEIDQIFREDLGDYISFDYEEIINDMALTTEELRAEIQKVQDWIDEINANIPAGTDVTYLLVNPDYEQGATGWSGNPTMGSGGGNTCAEAYDKASFDVYQVVNKARLGVYSIEVQGFFRLGRPQHEHSSTNAWQLWLDGQQIAPAFVYMNDNQTALKCIYEEGAPGGELPNGTQYTQSGIDEPGNGNQYPNTMQQAAEAFAAGMYKSKAYGLVAEQGTPIRIGVKGALAGPNWAIWDNFKLVYEGFDANVIRPILQETVANAEARKNEPMSKTAYEFLTAAIAAANESLSGNDGSEMFNALKDLFAANEVVSNSIAKFAELAAANESLLDAIGSGSTTMQVEAGNLYEEIKNALSNHSIEDADVDEYLRKIKAMKTKLRLPDNYADASDLSPVDLTAIVENPAYDDNADGWEGTTASRNGTAANVEIFNSNFDYYQDIYGLPAGTYQVSVQAFYRAGTSANDYQTRDDESLSHAFIYALNGDSTVSSKALMRLATGAKHVSELEADYAWASESEGMEVPNTMVTAGDEFMNGKYNDNKVTAKVGADGYLRIGLKKNVNIDNNWTLWDNWQLQYFGANSELPIDGDASGIENADFSRQAVVEYFTLDGRKVNAAQRGILVQKVTMGNGAVIVRKVQR